MAEHIQGREKHLLKLYAIYLLCTNGSHNKMYSDDDFQDKIDIIFFMFHILIKLGNSLSYSENKI